MDAQLNGDEVDNLAAELRRIYITERCRAQRLEKFTPGDKYNVYFKRAAKLCIQARISPREFILVQFYTLKPYPEISAIGSRTAMERFIKHRRSYAVEEMNHVMLQLQAFERLVEAGWNPAEVLDDSDQGFDSLFIYIVSDIRSYPELKKKYFEKAAMQYACGFYYDQIYQDAIPGELKTFAEKLRSSI